MRIVSLILSRTTYYLCAAFCCTFTQKKVIIMLAQTVPSALNLQVSCGLKYKGYGCLELYFVPLTAL